MSNCFGCKYYDSSVDCCNGDDKCYMDGYSDALEQFDEEIKEIKHCLQLAKEQMLIDYVYVACEHLNKIEQLKELKNECTDIR